MRGRHPSGADLADAIEGSAQARQRFKAMLETVAGQKRITEACEELGIGEAQFHKLRHKMMEGAMAALEPSLPGRPMAENAQEAERVTDMREEIRQLRIELRAAQIREEVALLMPYLVKAPEDRKKKGPGKSHPAKGRPARQADPEDR